MIRVESVDMALIEYVDPEEAPAEVQEILEDHKRTNGRYSMFERMQAHNPDVLEARVAYYKQMIHGGNLSRELKELAHVTTSLSTGCEYCASSHNEKLVETVGTSPELTTAVAEENYHKLTDRQRAVVKFTEQVVDNAHKVTEDHVKALRDVGFSNADIIELLALVTHAMGSNAFVDALNVSSSDYNGELPSYHPEEQATDDEKSVSDVTE